MCGSCCPLTTTLPGTDRPVLCPRPPQGCQVWLLHTAAILRLTAFPPAPLRLVYSCQGRQPFPGKGGVHSWLAPLSERQCYPRRLMPSRLAQPCGRRHSSARRAQSSLALLLRKHAGPLATIGRGTFGLHRAAAKGNVQMCCQWVSSLPTSLALQSA